MRPLHHRDGRADDWICTSMSLLTRQVPSWVEPRRPLQRKRWESNPQGTDPATCSFSKAGSTATCNRFRERVIPGGFEPPFPRCHRDVLDR